MNETTVIHRERAEQVQQEIMSRGIHRALAGQHKPSDTEILEKLRRESVESIKSI